MSDFNKWLEMHRSGNDGIFRPTFKDPFLEAMAMQYEQSQGGIIRPVRDKERINLSDGAYTTAQETESVGLTIDSLYEAVEDLRERIGDRPLPKFTIEPEPIEMKWEPQDAIIYSMMYAQPRVLERTQFVFYSSDFGVGDFAEKPLFVWAKWAAATITAVMLVIIVLVLSAG